MRPLLALWLAAGLALAAPAASAGSIAGVCPDGSAFVVQEASQIPCARPKLVDPSELPPLRPEYLPRPYGWIVDQELRNPQNPYNLIEAAEKIRAAREAEAEAAPELEASTPAPESPAPPAPLAGAGPAPRSVRLALADQELRDLVELVGLRQSLAPAEFRVTDALGAETLRIQVAYSASLEARVLEALGRDAADWRVLVFAAHAIDPVEFHPNFFVVQDQSTFRPDPGDPSEVGLLLGEPGAQSKGSVLLGYFALPTRFDPARDLDLWWNDRSLQVALDPAAG